MEFLLHYKSEYAVLIVRIVAGVLFLWQGYDKLFRIGLKETAHASHQALHALRLPQGIVTAIVSVTALIEFICGALLIVGFLIIPSSYLLLACILPVTLAMSMREPMWNVQLVWSRLVLLTFLLLMPVRVHVFSIDQLLHIYAK
jgi:putative oxidoreductase